MNIDNDWLLENLSGSYSLGAVDDAIDSLIGDFDSLIGKIQTDERNYMLEAVSTMKDKIITSRVENVLELIDSSQFADGDEFRIIGAELSISAKKYTDNETGLPAWTIDKLKTEMGGVFQERIGIEGSAVEKGYLGSSNTVSVGDLSSSRDVLARNTNPVSAPFVEINSSSQGQLSIINIDAFVDRYITGITEGESDLIKLTIDSSLRNIKLDSLEVSSIEHSMSDGELKGSGSKLTDYTPLTVAGSASEYEDTIDLLLAYATDYTVNVSGTDYTYTPDQFDNLDGIASGLSDEIGLNTDLTVSLSAGYFSKVFENGNSEKVFGWYALDTDGNLSYEVEMVNPGDTSDLTIEQDGINQEKIIITFEHDGFDLIYPTIGDIRDLVNAFTDLDINIRVQIMPGFNAGDEYNVLDSFALEQLDTKITVRALSQQTVTVPTAEENKYIYTHVSDYSEATTQTGSFEVVKFNPANTYYITINGTQLDVDPNQAGNESIIDEQSLALALAGVINSNGIVSASRSGSVVTISALAAGVSFTATTSGEYNYVQPLVRDTLLRYDMRALPYIEDTNIFQLKKGGLSLESDREPVSKQELEKLSTSGYVFSPSSMMMPQIPSTVGGGDNAVAKTKSIALSVESTFRRDINKIATSDKSIEPVLKGMARLTFPMYSTDQAKSSRWFFAEAGANGIVPASALNVALSTVSPYDYEKLVLQDVDATFSHIRDTRLPNVGQIYESINSLLTEETSSYNYLGDAATVSLNSGSFGEYDFTVISEALTDKQLEGFLKYALLPRIVSGFDAPDYHEEVYYIEGVLGRYNSISGGTLRNEDFSITLSFYVNEFSNEDAIKDAIDGSGYSFVSYAKEQENPHSDGFGGTTSGYKLERITVRKTEYYNYIFAQNKDEIYMVLLELAIQIDDALREQRFIALAGAYVMDAANLTEKYSDSAFADFVFGVNEADVAPENNYGLGGIPIDGTITMSKLYFRNMKDQAKVLSSKEYSLPSKISTLEVALVQRSNTRILAPYVLGDVSVTVGGSNVSSYSSVGNIGLKGSFGTHSEDLAIDEFIRTGFFSSNIDLALNKSVYGISHKYGEALLTTLFDAIEIKDNGSIVSINSARSYIQSFYQSFDSLSEEELSSMMLPDFVYVDRSYNSYSALTTLFLKIFLYLKKMADDQTVDYSGWEAAFNSIVGYIFADDNFETGILSYDMFERWLIAKGLHKAFTWSASVSPTELVASELDLGLKIYTNRGSSHADHPQHIYAANSFDSSLSYDSDGQYLKLINVDVAFDVDISESSVNAASGESTLSTSLTRGSTDISYSFLWETDAGTLSDQTSATPVLTLASGQANITLTMTSTNNTITVPFVSKERT